MVALHCLLSHGRYAIQVGGTHPCKHSTSEYVARNLSSMESIPPKWQYTLNIYKFSVSEHYLPIFENGIDSGRSTLDRCKIPVLQLFSRGFHSHFDFAKMWGYWFPPPALPPPPVLLPSPNSTASSSLAFVVMCRCKWIYYKYNPLRLFRFACMNVLLGLTTIIGWGPHPWED